MNNNKKKKLTQVQIDRLHELRKQRKSVKAIAEEIGASTRTVRRYIYGVRQKTDKQKIAPQLQGSGCFYTSPHSGEQIELPTSEGDPLSILIALEEIEEYDID